MNSTNRRGQTKKRKTKPCPKSWSSAAALVGSAQPAFQFCAARKIVKNFFDSQKRLRKISAAAFFYFFPGSVVDKLILIAPAVKLSYFCTYDLGRMLRSKLSHRLEMYLRTRIGHIKQELFCE